MISNEFVIKLLLDYEEKDGEKIVMKELSVALKGEMYFVKFIINPNEDDVEPGIILGRSDDWDAILEGVDFGDIPQLDGINVPPYICNMGKSSRNKKKPCGNYKMTYSDEGPSLTYEKTINSRRNDSVMMDKLKLDGEVEIDEGKATEEVIRTDTGSNINVIPYRIYAKLGREEVKPVNKNITMLDHFKAEPMGILKDTSCTNEFEVGSSSRPKRTRQHETVEEAMLPRFDEIVTDEELMLKKVIKFRLGGRGHRLTILEFARRLGLYSNDEIQDEGPSGNPSSSRIAKRAYLLTGEMLDGLSALVYCRPLDTTTLRELIGSNGRLIAEEPAPGDPRVVAPRPPRRFIFELYDRMGRMKIQQGELERMSRRQSYHFNRYVGLFKYMAGHYNVPL
ncbi:hypothetical protein Tco_1213159 [Tanacetum coccineum]